MVNTPRERALANELRAARKACGMTLERLGTVVEWSRAKVGRVETAERGVTEGDVATLLAGLGVTGDDRERLLKMARELDQPAWWELHKGLASQITALIDAEQRAVRITEATLAYVPGLLQTRAYSQAIFEIGNKTPAEIDDAVNVRRVRQGVLYKADPVEFLAFMDEAVLNRPVGGPLVAAEQLRHIVKEAERPNITVRVLPSSLGAHLGLDGTFSLLEFARSKPNIYVGGQNAGLVLDDPDEATPYRTTIATLASVALTPEESVQLIATYAAKFEGEGAWNTP
jgi:transcriptional regulator with XRE-family HTH domain